ncbi:Trm112 family protein [Methylocella sp.]|uniref:Trm112 family protein n=1 Tax=Methylocella sp. TaxID=1978226 RepID=UPI0035B20D74
MTEASKTGADARRSGGEAAGVDPRLLEILVCPQTKTTLEYDRDRQELISRAARLAYPIRDGVPVMLPEEARPLDD